MNNRETIDGVEGEWRTVDAKLPNPIINYRVNDDGDIERFFPLAVKPAKKRKVAKVRIHKSSLYHKWFWHINRLHVMNQADYSSEASALRGAKRFCHAIGYEMEALK
jgi:hypothetical protein